MPSYKYDYIEMSGIYICLRICSVDDIKVDIDWIRAGSEQLLQPETKEQRTMTGKQIYRTKMRQLNTS
jgi:hypothetical protein